MSSYKCIGCSRCPFAGHIELIECPDAYTDKACDCGMYNTQPIDTKEE